MAGGVKGSGWFEGVVMVTLPMLLAGLPMLLAGLPTPTVASIGFPTTAPAVSPTLVSFATSPAAYFANFYSVKCPIFPSNLLITSSTVYWFGLDDFAIASAIIGTCVKNI